MVTTPTRMMLKNTDPSADAKFIAGDRSLKIESGNYLLSEELT